MRVIHVQDHCDFLDLALQYTLRTGCDLRVAEKLIALGADINHCIDSFQAGYNAYSRDFLTMLVKAGVWITEDVKETTFIQILNSDCTFYQKTELADYMIELGALKPLTLVQTDLKFHLPDDRTLWNMPILIQTIVSQNCIHWLDFLTKHNFNIAANVPDNCFLLARSSQMIDWFLDHGILPKSEDEVTQLAIKAMRNRFHTSITRLINLGLISALQVFDLMIFDFLSTNDPRLLELYCVVLQALSHMGSLESVLNERKDFELMLLTKCAEFGHKKLEPRGDEYKCLERCLYSGVGKSRTQPLVNFESDSALYIQQEAAVAKCVTNRFPRGTIWLLDTPGYHPSQETMRLVLEVSLRDEVPLHDVFDHVIKLVMESEKFDFDVMIYEPVCQTYFDEYQSTVIDASSKLVFVLEILANRSYRKVAPSLLAEVVSKLAFLTSVAEKSKSAASVFFWMFDVQLISETLPEMDMIILLTRLMEKKLFDVIFHGFVTCNINTFDVFMKVLRDCFRKNTGVTDNNDESNAGVECVKWMVQHGLLADEEKSGKVLGAIIEGGNAFAARMIFAMGYGNERELLEIWKVIRVGFFLKRAAMKELLDQLLPGGWDSGYELISIVGQNTLFGPGLAGLEEHKSKGRRARLKKNDLGDSISLGLMKLLK
ncbi:hypothetical protein HDU76_007321 [Blyttiomyces sp. JEL0837]|nr:hypothetical protein HDU76_007321 [Blyttiomyces sp. JEL0837]